MDDDFVFTFPMFMVAFDSEDTFEPVLCFNLEGNSKLIPFFTERLHAERFRDGSESQADIMPLDTRDELKAYADHIGEHCEVKYVAIDPFPESGKPAVIKRIADL